MNILHVAHIADNKASGVAVVVPKHVEYQAKLENVALLSLDNYVPQNSVGKYQVFNVEDYGSRIENLPAPFNKPDLVVFHEIYRPAFVRISFMLRRNAVPYIIVPHNSLTSVSQHIKRTKKIVGNTLLFNKYINNAISIHYLSEQEKNASKQRRPMSTVIGNGMDMPRSKKIYFTKKGLRLIYVGRLDTNAKGLDILLEAANIAKKDMLENKISILIAGPDHENDLAKLKKYIKMHKLEKVVTITDPVFDEDKTTKILDCDCFIQLSRSEGQPLGILEAMSLGVPPIVTEGTTLYDIVENYELGFPVIGEADHVARAILEIYENKMCLPKLSVQSRLYIKKYHNWDIIGRNTVERYRNCISKAVI